VLVEPSNGLTAMLGATFLVLLFLSRISYKWWLWPILAFTLMGTTAVIKVPYIQARIQSYMHPEQDLLGRGHQPFQSKIATGSGGVLGRGLGKVFKNSITFLKLKMIILQQSLQKSLDLSE